MVQFEMNLPRQRSADEGAAEVEGARTQRHAPARLRGCPIHLFRPGGDTTPDPEGPPRRMLADTGWLRRIRLLEAKADIARTVLHVAE
jgi:hypothetical protein